MSDSERAVVETRFREVRKRMKKLKGGKLYKLPPAEQREYDRLFKEGWELYLKLGRIYNF